MQADDRGESGAFADAALPFFGVPDVRTLASLAVSGRITRPVIASFAPRVHDAAAAGDADGLRIIADAADALASLAALTIARLNLREGPVAIALSGGSFADAGFTELVRARVRVHVPHARIVVAAHDAAVGAALLAFDDAGLVRPTILAP
jgi:N-acetylglucosamine kinase-like BadF-type ATPase